MATAGGEGWLDTGSCAPGEGIHAFREEPTDSGDPWPIELLFDSAGDLLGFEVVSEAELPTGPWEHGEEFDPWTIHIWFRDPASACEQ